jgi:hypothetical protein
MDETIQTIVERSHRPNDKIIFDPDPKSLVEKIIKMIEIDKII